MPDGHFSGNAHRPLLLVALGRQRVGKTALLNTIVQYYRGLGSEIEVWNADQQNRTHSLSTFFPDADCPVGTNLSDSREWIEGKLRDQAERRYHAVLDAGGGFTGFTSLVEDVPVIDFLSAHGIDVIGLFCVGPEKADLDYLDSFAQTKAFMPKATMIVMNAGLVLSGRTPEPVFQPIVAHPTFREALSRGAEVAMFPSLTCMSAVTDRGLTFEEAAEGKLRPGQEPMSFFDPPRVREWWTKKIPVFLSQFPQGWLPAPQSAVAATSDKV
jgi:hypothetical protein